MYWKTQFIHIYIYYQLKEVKPIALFKNKKQRTKKVSWIQHNHLYSKGLLYCPPSTIMVHRLKPIKKQRSKMCFLFTVLTILLMEYIFCCNDLHNRHVIRCKSPICYIHSRFRETPRKMSLNNNLTMKTPQGNTPQPL